MRVMIPPFSPPTPEQPPAPLPYVDEEMAQVMHDRYAIDRESVLVPARRAMRRDNRPLLRVFPEVAKLIDIPSEQLLRAYDEAFLIYGTLQYAQAARYLCAEMRRKMQLPAANPYAADTLDQPPAFRTFPFLPTYFQPHERRFVPLPTPEGLQKIGRLPLLSLLAPTRWRKGFERKVSLPVIDGWRLKKLPVADVIAHANGGMRHMDEKNPYLFGMVSGNGSEMTPSMKLGMWMYYKLDEASRRS